MIAAWMLYCALCAAGLSAAATLAERALLAARGPLRVVWFGAVLLSLAIPAVALTHGARVAVRPIARGAAAAASPNAAALASASPVASVRSGFMWPSEVVSPPSSRLTRLVASMDVARTRWSTTLRQADRPLAYLWLALSTLLGLYFVGVVGALAVMRRGWRRDVVLDVPVFISSATGPALVGMLSPAIVVPEWALTMDASQLGLMLRHEQEHRRARDSQLLTLAHVSLVIMPWNAALWWQIRRLRAAVEMDCDARVLQHVDVRSYGDLLLEVVRPGRGLRLMGATAFAERATQLERRIRVMARRRQRASNAARALVLSIALLALSVAWIAPRPASPAMTLVRPASTLASKPHQAWLPVGASVASRPAANAAASRDADRRSSATVVTVADAASAARSALFAGELASLRRFGTSGVINPMLMILRASESLRLTAPQADSIATLNRRYMVQLSGIWSPVIRQNVAVAGVADGRGEAALASAGAASMHALIELSPRINSLLTPEQREQLSPAIAANLDVVRLAAIGASEPGAGGVFSPDGGLGSGPGGRGRIGGPGR